MIITWPASLPCLIPDGVRAEVVKRVFTQELELAVTRDGETVHHTLISYAEQLGPGAMELMHVRTRLALGLLPRFRRYRRGA
jgi:hypothetical protein